MCGKESRHYNLAVSYHGQAQNKNKNKKKALFIGKSIIRTGCSICRC